jgi:hypothetical protein
MVIVKMFEYVFFKSYACLLFRCKKYYLNLGTLVLERLIDYISSIFIFFKLLSHTKANMIFFKKRIKFFYKYLMCYYIYSSKEC